MNAVRVLALIGAAAALVGGLLIFQRSPIVSRPLREPFPDAKVVEAKSGDFFGRRNTATIVLPRDMSFSEFVQLYQLQQTRDDIARTLSITGDPQRFLLRRGQNVTVPLTPSVAKP